MNSTLNLRALARQSVVALSRLALGAPLLRRPRPVRLPSPHHPSVHLLISHRTWGMSLLAARSLEWSLGQRAAFWFHDDGTLPPAAFSALHTQFPECHTVARTESDARWAALSGKLPLCSQVRRDWPWPLFLKALDPPLFAPGPHFMILDSDVLFFEPPTEILDWMESALDGRDALFMSDDKTCCFTHPVHELRHRFGVSLPGLVNTGIALLPKSAFPLPACEDALSLLLPNFPPTRKFVAEQTLLPVVAARHGPVRLLPAARYTLCHGLGHPPGAISCHYIGESKHSSLWLDGVLSLSLTPLIRRRRLLW